LRILVSLCTIMISLLVFFFSSRRRHTRFSRDWSSDVCSSDLPAPESTARLAERTHPVVEQANAHAITRTTDEGVGELHADLIVRSEERRVGKECRSRWPPHP